MTPEWLEERIRADIARRGQSLISVFPGPLGEPGWAYSVGLARHGLPELVTVGLPPQVAGNVLNELADRLRDGRTRPESGVVLAGIVPRYRLRFDAVHPRWIMEWAPAAVNWANRPVDALQVVWPDEKRRWPEHPAFCAHCTARQPRLGTDDPWWPHAFTHSCPAGAPTDVVHARVRNRDDAWTSAWEALPVRPVDSGRFRVEAVPFHRVGCTFGDVVEVVTEPCRDGVRRVVGEVVEPSGRRTVLVRLDTPDPEAVAAFQTSFERLLSAPHELDDEVPASCCAIAVDHRDEGVVADVAELYGHDVLEYL